MLINNNNVIIIKSKFIAENYEDVFNELWSGIYSSGNSVKYEKINSDNIMIESSDTTFLRILQNKRSGLKLFIYPNDFEDGFQIASTMNLFGITIHTDYITTSQLKLAHDNGFRVTLWGIGTNQANIDAILKSPDFIQTDKPIHLLKVFGKYKD